MHRSSSALVLAVALSVAGCSSGPAEADPAQVQVPVAGIASIAEPAPRFSLTLFDGSTFSLADHIAADGRPVFLNFWASWCPPCRDEMPDFDEAARNHPGVLFVGVAVDDDTAAARAFAVDELALSYPVGADEDGSVAGAFDFFALPTSWLISGDGDVVAEFSGRVTPEVLEHVLGNLG